MIFRLTFLFLAATVFAQNDSDCELCRICEAGGIMNGAECCLDDSLYNACEESIEDAIQKRRGLIGKRRGLIGKRRGLIGKRRGLIGKRRGLIGKRQISVSKRRGLIGKRRGLIGKRRGLIGKRFTSADEY